LVLCSALSICLEGLLVLCLHDVIQAYVRLAQMRFLAITACANATSLSIWSKTVLRCPTSQFCCTCRLHDVVNSNFYSQAPGCLKLGDNSTEVATRRIETLHKVTYLCNLYVLYTKVASWTGLYSSSGGTTTHIGAGMRQCCKLAFQHDPAYFPSMKPNIEAMS